MNFSAEKRWKREKTHRFEKKWEDMKKVGAPAFRARIPGLRTRFAFPRIVLAYTGRHIHQWGFLTKGINGDNG